MIKLYLIRIHNHFIINTSGESITIALLISYVTNPCNMFVQSCQYFMLINFDEWIDALFLIETLHVTQQKPTYILLDTNLNAFLSPLAARAKKKSNTFALYGGFTTPSTLDTYPLTRLTIKLYLNSLLFM